MSSWSPWPLSEPSRSMPAVSRIRLAPAFKCDRMLKTTDVRERSRQKRVRMRNELRSDILPAGARGAIHVRGKDRVHPEMLVTAIVT